jgi:sRNA-binding protein
MMANPQKRMPPDGIGGIHNRSVATSSCTSQLVQDPVQKKNPDPRLGEIIELLSKKWPNCFSVYEKRRRPLAIGIHKEVITSLDGVADETAIGSALAFYVGNSCYLGRIRADRERIGLDGKPAGVVTTEEERNATQRLMARKRRKEAKFKEAAKPTSLHPATDGKIVQAEEEPSISSNGKNPNAAKPLLTLRRRS